MPEKEHFMSVHDQAAVVYVVSRSGKVLGSEDCSSRIYDEDYFEGELEGWIFWGSRKRSTGSCKRSNGGKSGKLQQQEAFVDPEQQSRSSKGFVTESFRTFLPAPWNKKIPFLVWGEEPTLLSNVFPAPSWKQGSSPGRKTVFRQRHGGVSEDDNSVFVSSLSSHIRPQKFPHQDHHSSLTKRNYTIGLSQLAVLQEWDPGTRESAARWVTWLLKMLRKTKAPPLQHLLFATCSAILPIMSCSLAREYRNREPDREVYKCVDVFVGALSKCEGCFSSVQWDILEERLIECQQLRMKVGSSENDSAQLDFLVDRKNDETHATRGVLSSFPKLSEDLFQPNSRWKNEQLSNTLLQKEGVAALVKRAVREKLYAPRSRSSHDTNVSLVCPLSGKRAKVPARGRGCSHSRSFDLQSFLEANSKANLREGKSSHERKKAKSMAGGWSCPICGSDATWPLLVVDRDLLRILEVLPEQMPLVSLQPNGRWHVVWTTGEDAESMDTQLTNIPVFSSIKPDWSSEVCGIGQLGEPWHDKCRREEEVWSLHEVQILRKAYTSWKDVHQSDRVDLGFDPSSNIAAWTGGLTSNSWPASPQLSLSYGEAKSKLNIQTIDLDTDDKLAPSLNNPSTTRDEFLKQGRKDGAAGDSIPREEENVQLPSELSVGEAQQPKAGIASQELQVEAAEDSILAEKKTVLLASGSSVGEAQVAQRKEETVSRITAGHFKSRPKLMARKT